MEVICNNYNDCNYNGNCYHGIKHSHDEYCNLYCDSNKKSVHCLDVIKMDRKIKLKKINQNESNMQKL